MFVANGFLWYATKLDGKLHKAPWNGTTVTGPSTIDTLATGNWAAPGVFVSPTAVVNTPPTANFTASCTALSCSFDASSSTAPGDSITSYSWNFGDGNTGSGQTTSHPYGSANTYNVQLTINTSKGNNATVTKAVTVSDVVAPGIAFVAQSNTNGNATSETLTVPGNVSAGNALVLVATGATGGPLTAPAGWTQIGTSSAGTAVTTTAWSRVATATDAGTNVSVGFGAIVHGTVQLLAYSGTNATTPVVASPSKATQITGTSYATPTTNVPANGDVVISVWSAKSSAVTGWTTPAGQTVRSVANGSGGGRVNSVATDAVANAGPAGGLTATTTGSAGAFAAWTIVLGP
jgi:PKD repeat protein